MGTNEMREIGFSDLPIVSQGENAFGTDAYVDALCHFVLNCATPMTVAIQGDWGSGKTSLMNLMLGKLDEQVIHIWFNTWQFSQFHLGDALPFSMLNILLKGLDAEQDLQDTVKNVGKTVAKGALGFMKTVALVATERVAGGELAGKIREATDGKADIDIALELSNLKQEFQEAVDRKLERSGKSRLVIFVDDLDRLEPERAVELLEILKLFLDCENCVFVLAVDYSVVLQGVKAKYGDTMSEEKGKSFFDKIIQLPFKMPVARYNIEAYLVRLLAGSVWGQDVDKYKGDIDSYSDMLNATIGKNPRSIKRIVNSFAVTNKVAENLHSYDGDTPEIKGNKQKLLFALLCMQLGWEELYVYIIDHAEEFSEDVYAYADKLEDDASFLEILSEIYPDKEITADSPTFKELNTVIDTFCKWVRELVDSVPESAETDGVTEVMKILSFSSVAGTHEVKAKVDANSKRQITSLEDFCKEHAGYRGMEGFKDFISRIEAKNAYNIEYFHLDTSSSYTRIYEGQANSRAAMLMAITPQKRAGFLIEVNIFKRPDVCDAVIAYTEEISTKTAGEIKTFRRAKSGRIAYGTVTDYSIIEELVELAHKFRLADKQDS